MIQLPPADTSRWTYVRKGAVLQGIEQGIITADEAKRRYALSDEELAEWQAAFSRNGHAGLRVTVR